MRLYFIIRTNRSYPADQALVNLKDGARAGEWIYFTENRSVVERVFTEMISIYGSTEIYTIHSAESSTV